MICLQYDVTETLSLRECVAPYLSFYETNSFCATLLSYPLRLFLAGRYARTLLSLCKLYLSLSLSRVLISPHPIALLRSLALSPRFIFFNHTNSP